MSTVAHPSPVGGSHSGKQQLEYKVSRYKLRAATCLTITATAAAEPLTEDYHSGDDLKGFLDAKSVKSHAISD
jgi:hypothetical protein